MTQVLTPVANKFGTYRLIMGAAMFKLITGLTIAAGGVQLWPLWGFLFLCNRLSASVWGFYNLSFSDVIDEDMLINKRRESMSVSVHGVQALFVKPAQSLAPILGVAFLPAGAMKTNVADMTPHQAGVVEAAAFKLLWAVPTVCGVIQVLIWRAYRLHGAVLKEMKLRLRDWESWLQNDAKSMGPGQV
ncbi:unnamed protein product [Choristocarpus tenellus]